MPLPRLTQALLSNAAFRMKFQLLLCLLVVVAGIVAADKLKVDFYAEALCPHCRRYSLTVLKPLFENGLSEGMDLTIYFAGNAKLRGGRLKCQHGADECYLNKVQGCAIARGKDVHQWWPFVECLERDAHHAAEDSSYIKACCSKAKLDYEDVMKCAEGDEGTEIQMEAYKTTEALVPPHRWVPWVVINGVPMYDLAYALGKILCLHVPKEDRPEICYSELDASMANHFDIFRTYPDAVTVSPVT